MKFNSTIAAVFINPNKTKIVSQITYKTLRNQLLICFRIQA